MTVPAPTLADNAISFTDLIGRLAGVGGRAQPVIHVLAQWVPIPYLAQIDNVLEMAAPYLAKIQAAAPVVSSAIDQDGRPALDAIQTHGPELLDAIKQVFAIASNEDPARPADALPISAADVTHDQVAGYGVIIFTPGKTNAEQQREWDRASQT